MRHEPRPTPGALTAGERAILTAIAQAALPAGNVFPAAGPAVIDRVERFLVAAPPSIRRGYRALLRSLDTAARVRYLRGMGGLSVERRLDLLHAWRTGGVHRRLAIRGLLTPLKVAHFDNPDFYRAIGCIYDRSLPQAEVEPRYLRERAHDAAETGDVDLEADVVVIGSGAGGAVMARELAERGVAVVILEEGGYFKRRDFNGHAFEMQRKMYRNGGITFSVGNVGIPIPVGRTVGGTTTINSGTCYRIPSRVLAEWRDEGLTEFTDEMLAGYYERVEEVLQVAPAQMAHLGGVARVISRGCDALGYDHKPLRRNAPGCDGQGVCCFGCPTDAKRSTNVSYVPMALKAGAELFYRARAERILTDGGRAVGVVARGPDGATITVRARAVVVSCGSLITPVFLQDQGLANSSGQLGRNLSIHPAAGAAALFDEEIAGFNAIPQGYAIEEFHDEGILFEGATTPLDMCMAALPFLGDRLVRMAEAYDRVAMFGFLVEDSSRGRVRRIGGRTVVSYWLNERDVARMKRGHEILARVFFAAGAKRVYPMVNGFEELHSVNELAAFRRARLRARDLDVSAYHPLGTARMGVDPSRSVVGPDHQCHDVPGLYIVDGSAVPSSLAVNPQVTIMAMATRAAEKLSERLD